MKKPMTMALGSILTLMLVLSGCGGKDEGKSSDNGVAADPNGGKTANVAAADTSSFFQEPTTVRLYSHYAAINNENDLNAIFGAVLKKYPNLKIELIKGTTLNQMIAAGDIPDLIATTHYHMSELLPLGVAGDLRDFVKEYNFDLNRLEPQAVNAVKMYGKNGELYGIPYTLNFGVLIYNKDIFNKFAAPYPTDGMTWEQITELARKVTRSDGGVQYIGIDPGTARTFSRGYSLPTFDEKTRKPVLDSDGYRKMFTLLQKMYSIPGYIGPNNKYAYGIDYFIKDQKLAMFPSWLAAITSRLPQLKEQGKEFDWDIAAHPVFSDKPEYGREIEFQELMVPPTTKNKEAAYQIILATLSDEAQTEMNKGTNLTILNKPELKKDFASNSHIYDGKNLSGIFKVKPAPVSPASEYDAQLYKYLEAAMKDMVLKGEDINSALRSAQEQGEKYVAEQMAQ